MFIKCHFSILFIDTLYIINQKVEIFLNFIFCCAGSSLLYRLFLVAAGGGYSLVVCRLLIVMPSLAGEHRL